GVWVRRLEDAGQVAADLDRGHHQAPGNAPPPEEQAEAGIGELALHAAAVAADGHPAGPARQEEERVHAVRAVHVDGTGPAAGRAAAAVDRVHAVAHFLRRYRAGDGLQGGLRGTVAVAVATV